MTRSAAFVTPAQEVTDPLKLSVVMPVYNEEEVIDEVVRPWVQVLDRSGVEFEFRIYDDGSSDRTHALLDRLGHQFPRIVVTHQENRGHGPTLLRGYRESRGRWVLQTDSDGEIPAAEFEKLWRCRDTFDLVLGCRAERRSPVGRRLLSKLATFSTWALFGRTFQDVNIPFRLMRRSQLRALLRCLPAGSFAPNVLLTGLAARRGLRIQELAVDCPGRRGGKSSLSGSRLFRASWLTFRQAVSVRLRAGSKRTGGGGPG